MKILGCSISFESQEISEIKAPSSSLEDRVNSVFFDKEIPKRGKILKRNRNEPSFTVGSISKKQKITAFPSEKTDGSTKSYESVTSVRGPFYEQWHTKDVAVYKGALKNSLFHGYGKLKFSNGDVYEGPFKNGFFHGEGTFRYAKGTVYEGWFINNFAHGFGKFRFPNGDVYEGNFDRGSLVGKGTLIYSDQTVYQGAFPGLYHEELIDSFACPRTNVNSGK